MMTRVMIPVSGDLPFFTVEKMPRFNGDLNKWLRKNLRYPARCAEMGIGGKVFVEFVVEKDGSISSINVVRSADPDLSQEAIRVVKAMPKWIPGMQRDKAVRVAVYHPDHIPVKIRETYSDLHTIRTSRKRTTLNWLSFFTFPLPSHHRHEINMI